MKYICYIKNRSAIKQINQLGSKTAGQCWVYLGDDLNNIENIMTLLGKQNQIKPGDFFHLIAKQLKPAYLDYIANIGKQNQASLSWWSSNMASKSPYLSQLFKLLCYRALVEELLDGHDDLLVFIDDPWFFDFLAKSLPVNKAVFIGKPDCLIWAIYLKTILVRIRTVYKLIREKIRLRGLPMLSESKIEVFLFSWVREHSFNDNGRFVDNYYGDLKQNLEAGARTVARLTLDTVSPSLLGKMRTSQEKYVHYLHYVPYWQIVIAFFSSFSPKLKGCKKFNGLDISRLLSREVACENMATGVSHNLLFARAMSRISKKLGALRFIVYPFQGQPWEKALIRAVKKARPEITLIGYQHSSFAPLLLNYYLGRGEAAVTPKPDLLLANSEYNRHRLAEIGFPRDSVKNVGAFRYTYLFMDNECRTSAQQLKKEPSVLVCLPYNRKLALEMLRGVFPDLMALQQAGQISSLRIKWHPLMPLDPRKIPGLEKYLEQISGSIDSDPNSLINSDVILYCNGTIGIEGSALGKKMIKFLPELEIDLDPLAGQEQERGIGVCRSGCLEQVFRGTLALGHQATVQGQSLIDPVNYDCLEELLVQLSDASPKPTAGSRR
jgi:hypothetical protein